LRETTVTSRPAWRLGRSQITVPHRSKEGARRLTGTTLLHGRRRRRRQPASAGRRSAWLGTPIWPACRAAGSQPSAREDVVTTSTKPGGAGSPPRVFGAVWLRGGRLLARGAGQGSRRSPSVRSGPNRSSACRGTAIGPTLSRQPFRGRPSSDP
jgi:hypothetical protein